MRELKFRAWDKKRKRMFAVTTLNASGAVSVFIDDELYLLPAEQIELMQYTDEYDVNNKEIAEGDIVQYVSANEEDLVQATVKYGYPYRYDDDDGTLFIKGFYYGDCKIFDFVDLTEEEYENLSGTKIIGNIHENPELCGEGEE